jgi:tetratricopeptide (TPR) repeat protein
VDVKRQLAITVLLGTGMTLTGCQSASLGGLAFWNKNDGALAASAPDVGSQRYEGLAKEFGGGSSSAGLGQARPGTTGLGGTPAASSDNFFVASWKKTASAVEGAFAVKPHNEAADDPLRLDSPTKKVGPQVYVAAGRLLENQGKYEQAEEQYQKALAIAPADVSALVGMARLHDRQGQSAKAVELYHRALKADPKSALAYNDLGLCHARQRQLDPSIQALGRAVQLQPENAKYRNNLATVLVEAGRTDDALRELSALGSPAVAHYNVGYLLHKKGQTADAQRHLQQALVLDPEMSPAREMLAQIVGSSTAPPAQAAIPHPARAPQALTGPAGGGSPYGYAAYSGNAARLSDMDQAAPTPLQGGTSFRIADEVPSSGGDYYGAPRPLPPIE